MLPNGTLIVSRPKSTESSENNTVKLEPFCVAETIEGDQHCQQV